MAGGMNAAVVPCMKCVGRAARVSEGMENDGYECGECGFQFLIDWSRGAPAKPCWPLSEEEAEEARRIIGLINKKG